MMNNAITTDRHARMADNVLIQWAGLVDAWATGPLPSPSAIDFATVVQSVTGTDATLGFIADVYDVIAAGAVEPDLLAEVMVEIFTRIR